MGTITLTPVRREAAHLLRGAWRSHWTMPPRAPRITVSFRWLPALRHATGTILAVEGGPGFASTGTESDYRAMIGPLLDSRNLLLIDLRGTGTSTPSAAGPWSRPARHQSGKRFTQLVGACGRSSTTSGVTAAAGWVHASVTSTRRTPPVTPTGSCGRCG